MSVSIYNYNMNVVFLSLFYDSVGTVTPFFPSQLRDEEVDILYVLISLNKNCSLQVWFAVLVAIAMELDLKPSHRCGTKIRRVGLTP